MILSLEAPVTGSGKSVLMFTAPLPLVTFSFDAGATRALYGTMWKLFDGIDVEFVEYPQMLTDASLIQAQWKRNGGRAITVYLLPEEEQKSLVPNGHTATWNYFSIRFNMALFDPGIASIGIDTATIMRETAIETYVESMPGRKQLLQIEYGKPNGMVKGLYSQAKDVVEMAQRQGRQKHLILTHHQTEVRTNFINSKGESDSVVKLGPNGVPLMQLRGLSTTHENVDVAMLMEKVMVADPFTPGKMIQSFQAKFLKCGLDASLEGTTMISPTWDTLAMKVNKNLHPKGKIGLRDQEGS